MCGHNFSSDRQRQCRHLTQRHCSSSSEGSESRWVQQRVITVQCPERQKPRQIPIWQPLSYNLTGSSPSCYYPSSLDHLRRLTLADGVHLFHQVCSAVDFLHLLNYNYMNIKPSNICVRENGDFVLVDLSSVVRKSESSESAVVYVPSDFQPLDKCNLHNIYTTVDVTMTGWCWESRLPRRYIVQRLVAVLLRLQYKASLEMTEPLEI